MKKTIEKIEAKNDRRKLMGFLADVVIAYVSAPFAAVRHVRQDIMNPANVDQPVRFFKMYGAHVRAHVDKNNGNKFWFRAWNRADARIAAFEKANPKYNPMSEIHAKGLDSIINMLSDGDFITVRYFDATEHQSATPRRCRVGDYMIDFAPDGTKWCDGMRGCGYVFKRNAFGDYEQKTTISPELSGYLAEIADTRAKMQNAQMARSAR